MKITIKDILFKQMLNILNIFMVCIVIFHSYQKEQALISVKDLFVINMIKILSFSHKNANIKSWINIEKSTSSKCIESRGMVKIIY